MTEQGRKTGFFRKTWFLPDQARERELSVAHSALGPRFAAGPKLLSLLGLAGLLLFQAWAYLDILTLSLGPRVIFQPWLMRLGYLPYENIADQHSPLMPLILTALTPLFADGLVLAQTVLVALLSLSTLLAFLAGRRSAGWLGGLGAAFFFVLWSPIFGFGKLWHESFLAPLYILILLLVLSRFPAPTRTARWLVILGFLGGVAVLIKQHALVVLAAVVGWNAFITWRTRRSWLRVFGETALLVASACLPLIAYGIYHYLQAGTLRNMLYWTVFFNYESRYASLAALPPRIGEVWVLAVAFLPLLPAVLTTVTLGRRRDAEWRNFAFGLILMGAGSLTVYPRFAFFHLQPILPLVAWLSSVMLARALRPRNNGRKLAAGVALAAALFWAITAGLGYRSVFRTDPPRRIWEYSDLEPLADEIRRQIGPMDRIYVIPDDESTTNLYYLVRRLPPKFWSFTYPWYMQDWVKTRIGQTLAADPPAWVVYFPGRADIERIAPEVASYIAGHYQRVARLDWMQGEVWLLKRNPRGAAG